jgi:hypothetical protein
MDLEEFIDTCFNNEALRIGNALFVTSPLKQHVKRITTLLLDRHIFFIRGKPPCLLFLDNHQSVAYVWGPTVQVPGVLAVTVGMDGQVGLLDGGVVSFFSTEEALITALKEIASGKK